jgi:hypothetical protein
LYTREILPAPERPVQDGRPLFGSYSGPFGYLDIRGMKRPFGDLPIPSFLTDLRVMDSMRFLFCDENNIGEIELFDAGYFSFMETTLWNRKTRHRIAYRRIILPHLLRIPRRLDNSVVACRTRSRYVRIQTRLQKGLVQADFAFRGSGSRPPCDGRLVMSLDGPGSADLSSLIPYGVKRRCQGSWQVAAPLSGLISTGYADYQLQGDAAVGFLDVRKAYYSLRTKVSNLIGLGRLEGKVVSFQLGNPVCRDDSRYNDNVLFVDGKAWPLPPVRITRPYGINGDWIIQDTESMVDLVFTPVSDSSRSLSAFIVRTNYHTVYGTFEGVLLTGDGERISLRGFPGIGKKILLRV